VAKLFSGLSFDDLNGFLLLMLLMMMVLIPFSQSIAQTTLKNTVGDPILAGIRIEVKEALGDEEKWTEMVQTLVLPYLKKGDRFSAAAVSRLSASLKACRRFQHIHLDTATTESGLLLMIAVTPFKLIKDIRIHGKYPLFEKQILNTMTLYPGDAFIQEEIDKQPHLIAQLYQKYGYIDPVVTFESFLDPRDNCYTLKIFIEKGRQYRLGKLEITGNEAFDDSEIRLKVKSIRTDNASFAQSRFLEDLEKLKRFYFAKRYPDVVIEHQLQQNPETGKVDVGIVIDEGERYDISFTGNTAFGNRKLRKDLVLFDSGNRRGSGLRKSIENIKTRYRRAGYSEIAVQVETEPLREEAIRVRKLRLVLSEGTRAIVRKIEISGNAAVTENELKKRMLTRPPVGLYDGAYVAETLNEDILAIQNLYHAKGYLNAEAEKMLSFSADRENVAIYLKIDEGLQTRVARLELEGLSAVSKAEVLRAIQLQAGEPFSRGTLKNDENRIAMMVSEKGYPHVKVSGDVTINEDSSQAHVVFRVVRNSYTEMGKTFYAGNFRTREIIFERELKMKPGDPFSLKKMLQGQQDIRSMNIFRSVTFHPVGLKEEAESIHLFTEVEEEKPFYFETRGGYASEKGFYGAGVIGDRNFLGSNRDLKIGGELSETGYNAESRIFEPRFLGTRVSSDFGVYLERDEPFNQTFGTDKTGLDILFSRKLKKRLKLNLGFNYERREQFKRDSNVIEDASFDPRSILAIKPFISYDSRDNFLNPKEGIFILLSTDVSRGIENSLDDFIKYRTDLRAYITPLSRLTFAWRGSFGSIDAYGSKGTVPDDQLFFLGGTTTVRGFDENRFLVDADDNPVGGRLMAVGNAEARIDIGSNLEFSLFYDGGYLDKISTVYDADNARFSAGIGLRYVTPVGAVGLVYGHKLDPEPGESPGRIHFSIGYTF
jgi:outer membrane protein insertion porin family